MGIDALHGLYGVQINSTLIGGITRQSVRLGHETRGEPTSAECWARWQSIVAHRPGMEFSTNAVAAALGACGPMGASIYNGLGGNVKLFAQKYEKGGTRVAVGSSSHRSYQFWDGILVPRRLTVDGDGDAELSYEAIGVLYSGDCTMILADSVTLPGGITDAERFCLGSGMKIGNISLPRPKRLEIDFGLEVKTEGLACEVYPSFIWIESVQPKITLSGLDVTWVKEAANIQYYGVNASHANTTLYLQRRELGSTVYAAGTSNHIKFTAAGLVTGGDLFESSGLDPAECSVILEPRYDGTNAPIVATTGVAIT